MLRTKLKWGAGLTPILQWDYLALALPRGPQALRGFLSDASLVAEVDGNFFAVTDPTAAAQNLPTIPGLTGVIVPRRDRVGAARRAP